MALRAQNQELQLPENTVLLCLANETGPTGRKLGNVP